VSLASIKGQDIINLPLSAAGDWTVKIERGEFLDSEKPTICFCHHGARSMKAAAYFG
jgi:rhodanese-related sulfurtransferase